MQFILTLFPPEQCWVLQVKHVLHISHTLRTSTLFRWGGGKMWLKNVANSIEKHVKKGRCPKTFWPGLLLLLLLCFFFFFGGGGEGGGGFKIGV